MTPVVAVSIGGIVGLIGAVWYWWWATTRLEATLEATREEFIAQNQQRAIADGRENGFTEPQMAVLEAIVKQSKDGIVGAAGGYNGKHDACIGWSDEGRRVYTWVKPNGEYREEPPRRPKPL